MKPVFLKTERLSKLIEAREVQEPTEEYVVESDSVVSEGKLILETGVQSTI